MGLWILIIMAALVLPYEANGNNVCDFFSGSWVTDESYPFYNSSTCPFVEHEFSCLKNGRPDLSFTHYRWQPLDCQLAGFNGEEFLETFRGKSIMFVGDSLSLNQWISMACLLHSSLPSAKYNIMRQDSLTTFTFVDYGVKVMYNRNVFLVDVVRKEIGRVLVLDSINGGELWNGIDMLIFNTWHWWNRRGLTQPWDFIQVANKTYKDMDRMLAFEKALTTWAGWVDSNIIPSKSMVFFQGISPSHYNGTLWDEPEAKTCEGQNQPLIGSTYPGGLPPAVGVLKGVLNKMRKPVQLLDITNLSLLRKDGHPSIYGLQNTMDCSHWCLAGVPDTWNQILYNIVL